MSIPRLEALVKAHMQAYDPSHDWAHVERVRATALRLAGPTADRLVVELAALMHDLCDRKYASAASLADVVRTLGPEVAPAQAALVLSIVPCVSYSAEMRMRAEGTWTWQDGCAELHAVQDADRLDAIGAVGVMRCAAFSGARGRVLLRDSGGEEGGESAEGHFYDKLLKVKGYMKTEEGRREAETRHAAMVAFLEALGRERAWLGEPAETEMKAKTVA